MRYINIILVLWSITCYTQTKNSKQKSDYLEDQVYIGLTFINLIDLPDDVNQNGFSNNFSIGFIKDIPLNLERNFALGIGLGYGQNTYFQNIKISEVDNQTIFELLDNTNSFSNNKFKAFTLEIPLELRWRTSTLHKYKFWRFYAGTKLSYAFLTKTKFKGKPSNVKLNNIQEYNKLQYGLTLAVGYGTWNFNFYYGLSDLFSNANLDATTPVNLRDFRLGLIFYIF